MNRSTSAYSVDSYCQCLTTSYCMQGDYTCVNSATSSLVVGIHDNGHCILSTDASSTWAGKIIRKYIFESLDLSLVYSCRKASFGSQWLLCLFWEHTFYWS